MDFPRDFNHGERSLHQAGISNLQEGMRIDDFELLSLLGQGAQATVFLARQRSMHRTVAVKFFPDHGDKQPHRGPLDHAHIVRVYDQRFLRERRLRLLYMQYLPGGTLGDLLQALQAQSHQTRSGARLLQLLNQRLQARGVDVPTDSIQREKLMGLSWIETVCFLGAQLADALEYAHAQGVLHGNLNPSNVLFSEKGIPKLNGFWSQTSSREAVGEVCQNWAYSAPEQYQVALASGSAETCIDGRTDLYSLGVVLWEMLTGHHPFEHKAPSADTQHAWTTMLATRLRGVSSERKRDFPVDAPYGLHELLLKAMSPTREQRFRSAGDMATQLRVCLDRGAARLLLTPEERLRRFAGFAPLTSIVATLLVPNVLAGCFNYIYNYESIVRPLKADRMFQTVMVAINSIAYPGAVAIGIALVWSICRAVRDRFSRNPGSAAPLKLRRACLRVPHRLAMVGICAWCLAGIAYPVALGFAGTSLSGVDSFHFFGSLVLCGLMGAAYPFFGAASITVGVWYPALVRPDEPLAEDLPELDRLGRLAPRYLVLAGSVPLLSLAILSVWGRADHRLILGLLSLGGLGLLFLMLHLWSQIGRDLTTLKNWARRQ